MSDETKTENRPYLNTKDAADYIGVSRQYLEVRRVKGPSRKKHAGEGPPFSKVGTRVMYKKSELDRFMQERSTSVNPGTN